MSRGLLDEATAKRIEDQLPSIDALEIQVLRFAPGFIPMAFDPKSSVPAAAVCLQDLANTLSESRFALHEALAHGIWYREKESPSNEVLAVFFMRFFLDDIALRLYSGGEHLAEAIIDMLAINRTELAAHFENKGSRRQAVDKFLSSQKNEHPLTGILSRLGANAEWRKAIQYRNEWVHGQPPLIKGLGIVYKRGQRWKISDDGKHWSLGMGGGDEPTYSVDDLLGFVRSALLALVHASEQTADIYSEMLRNQGITSTGDSAAQPGASAVARPVRNI